MGEKRTILIVGAGLAGARVAGELRSAGFDGDLRIVGAEPIAPYDHPPLSKELLTRDTPDFLSESLDLDLTHLADEVRLGAAVRGVRREGARLAVDTADGELVADAVVAATGAHAVLPPGWAAFTLHTWQQAEQLRSALSTAKRLVIVGAGWIGSEVASVAAAAGIDVTVVEAAPAPLSGPLGAAVGALTAPWHTQAGVRLLTNTSVTAVAHDGVQLASGEQLPADVVLASVGVRPATEWLDGTVPLRPMGSVGVDGAGRVLAGKRSGDAGGQRRYEAGRGGPGAGGPADDGGLPRIDPAWSALRAVGDCAETFHPRTGWVPGGHWDAALRHPTQVARGLLASDVEPDALTPHIFSDQFEHSLMLYGLPARGDTAVVWSGGRWWLAPGQDSSIDLTEWPAQKAPEGPWTVLYLREPTDSIWRVGAILAVDDSRGTVKARKLTKSAAPLEIDRSALTSGESPWQAIRRLE